jgi:hypothetical protein
MSKRWLLLVILFIAAAGAAAQQPAAPADSCRTCHALLDDRLGNPVKQFADDIHGARGLTCADCHGGNPRTDDMEQAMNPRAGYRGVPKRSEIPQLCSRCHGDGAYMRAYNPSLRTDQFAQYKTSVHGRRLAGGDTKVAVCSDCHGVHNIRPASSPVSSVNALRIAETCGRCHSNAEYMKPYKIPTDQLEGYRASVHFERLSGGDVAAPNCATCHGNHGAAPPGVASVERVCGTCHLFQEQLFDQSPHKKPWEEAKMAACITCHGNHKIAHTTDVLLGPGPDSLCATCHAEGDRGFAASKEMHAALTDLDGALAKSAEILGRAERAGMEVSEPKLTLSSGREQLIKARVEIHALNPTKVREATGAGLKLSREAERRGHEALEEYAFRRKGLALSLVVIAIVVLALWLYIRELERPKKTAENP